MDCVDTVGSDLTQNGQVTAQANKPGNDDNIGMSPISADKGFKMKHRPEMKMSVAMTGR